MITMTWEELERRAYTLGNTDVAELYGEAHDAVEEVDSLTDELDDANRKLQLSKAKLDDANIDIENFKDEVAALKAELAERDSILDGLEARGIEW